MILAGDIGGTNARLALFERRAGGAFLVALEKYSSPEAGGLEELLLAFRERHGEPLEAAAFGIAGPVVAGRVATTNLPWVVDAVELARVLGLLEVVLMNDLEALAWSLDVLVPEGLAELQAGQADAAGNRALIAAGTGLGEAALARAGGRSVVLASEGGHGDFAPRTELEIALLRWLVARHGRASWERVLSGRGLHEVYLFLRETRHDDEPAWLAEELRAGDPAAAISRAALDGSSELCAEALDLFASVYGAEAGNLALRTLSVGGVYLGGGIAPRILPWLERPPFLTAFLAKGRLRPLLEEIPVRVILDDRAGLAGAARRALEPAVTPGAASATR
ncbi:MAG TPA: glucokinase [Anaeromyxobacter sp.]